MKKYQILLLSIALFLFQSCNKINKMDYSGEWILKKNTSGNFKSILIYKNSNIKIINSVQSALKIYKNEIQINFKEVIEYKVSSNLSDLTLIKRNIIQSDANGKLKSNELNGIENMAHDTNIEIQGPQIKKIEFHNNEIHLIIKDRSVVYIKKNITRR